MNRYFCLLLTWALLAIAFQSCQQEDDLLTVEEELRRGRNNGGGPGDGANNNGNNGPDVNDLESEVLTKWQEVFVLVDQYAYGMRPNATARAIAYINLAAYETAIPQMNRFDSEEQRLQGLQINQGNFSNNVDLRIALNTAYADVLHHFMRNVSNNKKDEIDALEDELQNEYGAQLSQNEIADSRSWGSYVAQQIIEYSQTDAQAEAQILQPQPTSYSPPTGAGYWTFSANEERGLFPYWSNVRTFVISSDETSSVPPMNYNNAPGSAYYNQMLEVYISNNTAKAQQNEDLWIAEFWSDDVEGLMMSPPGRQVSIAKQLIEQENIDLEDAIVLMLRLGYALNDAAVSTWNDKYEYMVMRPSNFIKDYIDPDFQTNLYKFIYWPNPTFPGYPSGHSTFATAAAGVFIEEFGNNTTFTDNSHLGRTEFLSDPRTYNQLSDMAEENAFSRIPLGVHVRMDCVEGARLGYEIADAVNDLNLR